MNREYIVFVVAGLLVFAVIMSWLKTKVSPLIWLSRFFIHCEAVRVQTIRSGYAAYVHFKQAYKGCVADVKQEAAQ